MGVSICEEDFLVRLKDPDFYDRHMVFSGNPTLQEMLCVEPKNIKQKHNKNNVCVNFTDITFDLPCRLVDYSEYLLSRGRVR